MMGICAHIQSTLVIIYNMPNDDIKIIPAVSLSDTKVAKVLKADIDFNQVYVSG